MTANEFREIIVPVSLVGRALSFFGLLFFVIYGLVNVLKRKPWPIAGTTITLVLTLIFVVLYYISVARVCCGGVTEDMVVNPPQPSNFGINKTYFYHNFEFPFVLDEEKVTDSLMNGSIISYKNPTKGEVESLMVLPLNNGWKSGGMQFYKDGGSQLLKYYKTLDKPGIQLFYKYDMNTGKYSSIDVKFIHPKDMANWVEKK